MEIKLDRRYRKSDYSIGNLYVDELWQCNTLEDTDRGLRQEMGASEICRRKEAGKTAIPQGKYRVGLTFSPEFCGKSWAQKYGGRVLSIEAVPGFSGVRIHPGNWPGDTDGCVLVGKNTVRGGLTMSLNNYLALVAKVQAALAAGQPVWITII